jgi:hypothetical protein
MAKNVSMVDRVQGVGDGGTRPERSTGFGVCIVCLGRQTFVNRHSTMKEGDRAR